MRGPFYPHPRPHLALVGLSAMADMISARRHRAVVLVCVCPMVRDAEHLHASVGRPYVLFGEMPVQVLGPVFSWIICLVVELSFYFGNGSLCCIRASQFDLPLFFLLFFRLRR